MHLAKNSNSNHRIDFPHFYAKRKKIGGTERLRSLNPGKATAIAMSTCPIIVHFIWCGVWIWVRSKDAQNWLAQTSLSHVLCLLLEIVSQYFDLIVNVKWVLYFPFNTFTPFLPAVIFLIDHSINWLIKIVICNVLCCYIWWPLMCSFVRWFEPFPVKRDYDQDDSLVLSCYTVSIIPLYHGTITNSSLNISTLSYYLSSLFN